MSEWRIDEPKLLAVNTFLQRVDDVIVTNCLTRTAQESKLFPLMPYLYLCFLDAYYRFPDLIRKATDQISPEDIGHRSRAATTHLTKLNAWGTINFYLNGRALLIRAGLLRAEDNLEDLVTMVDFWQRFSRASHRNGSHEWTLDANDIAQEHDERVLQVFEADAYECDDALRHAAAKFMAAGTQYSFLVHCESRMGLSASGPYRLGGSQLMHTRDFLNLGECDMPWLDGVAAGVTHNNLTAVVVTDGVAIDITDWGTPYTRPENYQDGIVGFGLYTADFLTDRYTPVGMDSRAELIDTLGALTQELTEATRKLYSRFAGMTFDQMVEGGIYSYIHAPAETNHIAGVYDQSDWFFVDDRTRRFWEIANEEYSMDAYVDQFAVLMGKQGASTDYYLHPTAYDVWRRSGGQGDLPTPGRNAVLVPAHILSDHDYPLRVNPNGLASAKGTCSMDAKTAKYTVAGTKLAQDEMNDRARAFTSGFVDGPWRHLDENTVKWHYGDPEVDAMYRYTQERSRLLADRGASLVRSDIDAARTGAGERPWSKVSLQAAPVGGAA
jgi:hypothetical protein